MGADSVPQDYEDLIRVIHDKYDGMSKAYQNIAVYLTQNPNDVAVMSLNAIADTCGIHASSFVRFAQMLGYKGFKEVQAVFQRRLSTAAPGFQARIKALESELSDRENVGGWGFLPFLFMGGGRGGYGGGGFGGGGGWSGGGGGSFGGGGSSGSW